MLCTIPYANQWEIFEKLNCFWRYLIIENLGENWIESNFDQFESFYFNNSNRYTFETNYIKNGI